MDIHRKRFFAAVEKKDKQKARRFAFIFTVVSIILLLFPFMIKPAEDEKKVDRAVYVQFDKDDYKKKEIKQSEKAGKKSSTKPEKSAEPKKEPTPNPPPKAMPEPPKPKVQPQTKPLPKPTNLPKRNVKLITPERKIAFEPMLTDIADNAQVQEVSDEVLEVTEEMSADVMDDISKYFKTTGPASGDDGAGEKSNDSEAGEGTQGSSDTGDSDSDGEGEFGSDGDGDGFDGDGLLTRKVVYRANINEVVRENGKLVVNLCVNREGKVIWAQADPRASTLKDKDALAAAEATIKKYRYAKDYTVSERQCGRFAFIVKIEPE